jgi:hypothetical protein
MFGTVELSGALFVSDCTIMANYDPDASTNYDDYDEGVYNFHQNGYNEESNDLMGGMLVAHIFS